jgi:dephospho-CoA kinase
MLIGITGHSGSHKTDVAKHLCKAHGFTRLHAGTPVKKAVRVLGGLGKAQTDGKLRDNPTLRLGGASPRDLMEAVGDATHQAAPNATSVVLQRRVQKRLSAGQSVVVDGVRSPVEAATIKRMGGSIVRADNGGEPDPSKPMDRRQAGIVADQSVDTSGEKDAVKAATDQMLVDLRS